jgi:hypothetical protein
MSGTGAVSPVLRVYALWLDDDLPAARQQEVRECAPLLPGTARDGKDAARYWMALDWLLRTWAPAWLDLAGCGEDAAALLGLPRVADPVGALAAGRVIRQAGEYAAAARDAARAAARDAVERGDEDPAARSAEDDGGRGAALAEVCDAAWDAITDAAGGAAADWGNALDGALTDAQSAAWATARAAGENAVAHVVAALQDSAISLYRRLITGDPS